MLNSKAVIGRAISCIWKGKVVRSRSSFLSTPGYLNIREITTSDGDDERIEKLDEVSMPKLEELCLNRPVNCSYDNETISFVKRLTGSDVNVLQVEGRPIQCEILASFSNNSVHIHTHGETVSFQDICQQLVQLSIKSIDTAIRIVDAASLCMGNIVPYDTNCNERELLCPVRASKIITLTLHTLKTETRLVSTSCCLLRFGVNACEKCQYAFKLWNARERKRKELTESELIDKRFINERYLTRHGLEAKLHSEKKRGIAEKKKSKCLLSKNEEMINLSKNDSHDIKAILDQITTDKVPTEMKMLWEMQVKQLSAKSSKGHRWDPRLDARCIMSAVIFSCNCSNVLFISRIIRLALDIYRKSPKALDVIRQCVVLPSNRLLR